MDDADIVVEVDGKNIPINDFVKKFLGGMISGLKDKKRRIKASPSSQFQPFLQMAY
jgi:hypothetical protein